MRTAVARGEGHATSASTSTQLPSDERASRHLHQHRHRCRAASLDNYVDTDADVERPSSLVVVLLIHNSHPRLLVVLLFARSASSVRKLLSRMCSGRSSPRWSTSPSASSASGKYVLGSPVRAATVRREHWIEQAAEGSGLPAIVAGGFSAVGAGCAGESDFPRSEVVAWYVLVDFSTFYQIEVLDGF
ncbi:hypothetical protein B296_00020496 [Ensete ventricosum]|uniref:Uncharacterized protein n=1 Tax=Ensete ventricosum TaxID=4639 RepID=A0A427B135_ENSVE|nr:hypothetical protein B296_00020496 [Ensete ventricosum]